MTAKLVNYLLMDPTGMKTRLEAAKIPENQMTAQGLIFGTSAKYGSLNVAKRLSALDQLFPIEGDDFADIGCGKGSYTRELIKRCKKRISCVDILDLNINATRQAVNGATIAVDYHVDPAEKLNLPSDAYDAVFIIEVLDHVDDVGACLKEAYRILRPGGRCYISVPNRPFPLETHPVKLGGKLYSRFLFPFLPWIPPLHDKIATARVFTRIQMQNMAQAAGFSDSRFTYIMPPMEKRGGTALRKLLSILEKTPLRVFGVSLMGVFVK